VLVFYSSFVNLFENDTHCFINGLNYHEMLIYVNHWINNVETKKNDAMRHFIRDIKIIRKLSFCHFAHLINQVLLHLGRLKRG
jgi:hypothetical protein